MTSEPSHMDKLQRLWLAALERGDRAEADELQEMMRDQRDLLRCADCGSVIYLDVEFAGSGLVSVWKDYLGGITHFNPLGGLPLMKNHRTKLEKAATA